MSPWPRAVRSAWRCWVLASLVPQSLVICLTIRLLPPQIRKEAPCGSDCAAVRSSSAPVCAAWLLSPQWPMCSVAIHIGCDPRPAGGYGARHRSQLGQDCVAKSRQNSLHFQSRSAVAATGQRRCRRRRGQRVGRRRPLCGEFWREELAEWEMAYIWALSYSLPEAPCPSQPSTPPARQ